MAALIKEGISNDILVTDKSTEQDTDNEETSNILQKIPVQQFSTGKFKKYIYINSYIVKLRTWSNQTCFNVFSCLFYVRFG